MKVLPKITVLCTKRLGPSEQFDRDLFAPYQSIARLKQVPYQFRVGDLNDNMLFLSKLPRQHCDYYKKCHLDPYFFINLSLAELVEESLRDVDAVYIPGSGFDPSEDFCTDLPKKPAPDSRREQFELCLIRLARERGIPILTTCGGSWRLANISGAKTTALDKTETAHHLKKTQLRELTDDTLITPNSELHQLHQFFNQKKTSADKMKVNSTHARVIADQQIPFQREYLVNACDELTGTMEGYEQKYGVFRHGYQFHPDAALPSLENPDGSKTHFNDYDTHHAIFLAWIQAGQSFHLKKQMLAQLSAIADSDYNKAPC